MVHTHVFSIFCLFPSSTSKTILFSAFTVFVYAGGPHSHFAAEWNVTAAALTKLGFAVLMGKSYIYLCIYNGCDLTLNE